MDAYIIDALRTPIGRYGGTLSTVRPDDLAAHVVRAIVDRNPWLNTDEIEDIILGAANQSGEDNRNVARMAVLLAGLPKSIGGVTVNRLCASGLQAIGDAARAIKAGDGAIYIAGGVESMSRAPMVMSKATSAYDRAQQLFDTTLGWRLTNKKFPADYTISMGETAENVAKQWNVSRADQDQFAHDSQAKYKAAHETGKFHDEIVGVEIDKGKGEKITFIKDEHPRFSSLEELGKLLRYQ